MAGEQDNTVRIMSIHKSKGLEFPVVFLAGLGKRFNKQDAYGQILLDADLGAAADFLDLELRVKRRLLKAGIEAPDGAGNNGGGAQGPLCGHDQGQGKADYDSRG